MGIETRKPSSLTHSSALMGHAAILSTPNQTEKSTERMVLSPDGQNFSRLPSCVQTLQRYTTDKATPDKVPSIVHDVLASPGQPLDEGTRSYMEPRFGHDFSKVRIHADPKAAESVRSINALAYTVGNKVVFGGGQYMPETSTGRKLIAHELVHTMQRSSFPILQRQDTNPVQVTCAGDARRASPPGGVAILNGTLEWELTCAAISGQTLPGNRITRGTDVRWRVSFRHAGGQGACPSVTFIQTVIPTTAGIMDTGRLLRIREPASGAAADVLGGETEPFYGASGAPGTAGFQAEQNASIANASSGSVASYEDEATQSAIMIPPSQRAVREFEAAVICIPTGETFGSIRWGYTKTDRGQITLTGARQQDVSTQSATSQFESVRQQFYSGYFQHSLPGFNRGSAALTATHQATLITIIGLRSVRRIILVGANDNSGGPESNASLSLQRAIAARDFLIANGVNASQIQVEGHGVEAREPSPPGQQVAANRRVDIHLDRGVENAPAPGLGDPMEGRYYERQDPNLTFSELIDFLLEFQRHPDLSREYCNHLRYMVFGLRRWRQIDPSVPDVDSLYGSQFRPILFQCRSAAIPFTMPRYEPNPLIPPSFLPRIEESTREPVF